MQRSGVQPRFYYLGVVRPDTNIFTNEKDKTVVSGLPEGCFFVSIFRYNREDEC